MSIPISRYRFCTPLFLLPITLGFVIIPAAAQTPLTSDIQVNGYTQDDQTLPSVASDAAGNVVIVWQSWGQDGDGWGVFANRYDSTGAALGDEFQVNQRAHTFPKFE
jgi:hypothetical protein